MAAPKWVKGRSGNPQHQPESPQARERQRKCAYALHLRYERNLAWDDIAASLWPLDENGEPVPNAQPMWATRQACYIATTEYAKRIGKEFREEATSAILSRAASRQAALWPKIRKGDVEAIAEARLQDESLAKLLGLNAPTKIAATDPSGEKPQSLLILPGAVDQDSWEKAIQQHAASAASGKAAG